MTTTILTDEEVEQLEAAAERGMFEAIASDEPPVGLDPVPDEPAAEQLSLGFAVGGKKPTSSSVRIMGGKVQLPGEFRKGQVVVLRLVGKVDEIAFKDEKDSATGSVVGCERRHRLVIADIGLMDDAA